MNEREQNQLKPSTPLEKWVWELGAVVMPGEDYAKAF
jgi:hypothetical protein